METIIDYKRLYELSIIEKEKILTDNQKKQEKINELTEELNSYKIENCCLTPFSKHFCWPFKMQEA